MTLPDPGVTTPPTDEAQGDHTARESVSSGWIPRSYTREERVRAVRNAPGESGTICSDCGWLVDGPNSPANAEAQHREHVALLTAEASK